MKNSNKYTELCAPSTKNKTKQLIRCKREARDGQRESRAMTESICRGIDQRNKRKRKR